MSNIKEFKRDLEHLINKYSMENRSDTPDFVLADYLMDCLYAYENITNRRDQWFEMRIRQLERLEKNESIQEDNKG